MSNDEVISSSFCGSILDIRYSIFKQRREEYGHFILGILYSLYDYGQKIGLKVAHVEAGLRSRDMTMPEEINRLCTEVLCDYLFTTEPLRYLEFLHLNMQAKMVLTDSGGLQEETTVLGVPCLTLRENTERPITCREGTNVVVGNRKENILAAAEKIVKGKVIIP